jgi:cytochrome P450
VVSPSTGSGAGTDFRHAGVVDGVRFTAQVGLPNVLQGLFKKRPAVATAAAVAKVDALGYLLVQGLVERFGPDPFYVRVATDEALLLHDPADIEFVLSQSPDPFASDPDAKKKGMSAFQPDALTLSRGDLWRNRRDFAEHVLATGKPLHPLANTFLSVAEEAAAGLAKRESFDFDDLNATFQRITRQVVFGAAAAEDEALTELLGELMAAGNSTPGKPADGYAELVAQIQAYVDEPDADSLVGRFAGAPHGSTEPGTSIDPAGQAIHWLFAMGDTLPTNLHRTLAVLATHPEQLHEVRAEVDAADLSNTADVAGLDYLGGCILDTMRLWPTTPLFGRVTTRDVTFPGGQVLKANTQVLIDNAFNHRNRKRIAYADRFAPGEWASGDASESWLFNFFSHGPQGCPGSGLSIFLGQAFLAVLLAARTPLVEVDLHPGKPLPHALDVFALRISLRQRQGPTDTP